MKKYKFITIKQINDELFEKRPVYRIFNNKSNNQNGMVVYLHVIIMVNAWEMIINIAKQR